MRTIKLVIEYDGSPFVGWQVQPNGTSVQAVIEASLAKMIGKPVRLHSSGRTDAGVHALGMVAAFRTTSSIPVRAFSNGLNSLLPPEIAIREAMEVSPDFNPRRDALGKTYRYSIVNSPLRSPLLRRTAWHIPEPLDVEAMGLAASGFIGEHDFAAFRTSGCAAKTTTRRIDSMTINRNGDQLVIEVCGSGFLKNMIRMMVGTLVQVGMGKCDTAIVQRLLEGAGREQAGPTAPAHGLCLIQVFY